MLFDTTQERDMLMDNYKRMQGQVVQLQQFAGSTNVTKERLAQDKERLESESKKLSGE